jgi:pyruvate dehydrogenase E1 component
VGAAPPRRRFEQPLEIGGLLQTAGRTVWGVFGDGEMDEPESMSALTLAAREGLDNLVWVVNCNLQRLDGPVRGNGRIIDELEALFAGAGWHVIKLVWGTQWDSLLARDKKGILMKRMMECVDGEYQTFKSKHGAYVREHFFGGNDALKKLVANMADSELKKLKRGGHDPAKVYNAYKSATETVGRPTIIIAKTVWVIFKTENAY